MNQSKDALVNYILTEFTTVDKDDPNHIPLIRESKMSTVTMDETIYADRLKGYVLSRNNEKYLLEALNEIMLLVEGNIDITWNDQPNLEMKIATLVNQARACLK